MHVGIRSHGHDQETIKYREVAHNLQYGLLLCAHDMSGAHQFCRAAELRARSSCRYNGRCFPTSDERPCIGVCAWTGFYGQGLACDHRLIKLDRPTGQAHVGRDYTSK